MDLNAEVQVISEYGVSECPECGSNKLFQDGNRAEIICNSCGLVIEESIVDCSKEWREFDDEGSDRRKRVGAPLSLSRHNQGLSTNVGASVAEIYKLPPSKRSQYFRLKKWQGRFATAKERSLKYALSELKRYISYLDIPKNVEEATALIYRRAVEKGMVRGRSMESLVAGALYAACRQHGCPRTLKEISEVSSITKRDIGKAYRFIAREFGIKVLPTSSTDFVPRFATMLELSGEIQAKAFEIIKDAKEKEITSGKDPRGVAIAALYLAARMEGKKMAQKEAAKVAGITEITLRNRYKELVRELELTNDSMSRRERRKNRAE